MTFTQQFYDPEKILFFHLDAIYDMTGVVQKWYQPVKHPQVVQPEMPWEGRMTLPGAIYPSPDGKRLYAQLSTVLREADFPEVCRELSSNLHGLRVSTLASCEDGLHWQRERVGLVSYRGSTDNNILPAGGCAPMYDPAASDPQHRYKGMSLVFPAESRTMTIEESRQGRCFYSASSPDGIHWSSLARMEGFEETGDTGALCWDDRRGEYLFTTRKRGYWLSDNYPGFHKRPIKKDSPDGRWIALSTSSDFTRWSPLDNIILRDPMDELGIDFYVAPVFPYGDIYLAFLRRHHFWHGLMDTELVWSRDRLRWHRAWQRQAFLSWGTLEDADWCFGALTACKPVQHGDRLLMAYESRHHVHAPWGNTCEQGILGMDGAMGMATLRMDGFVALESGRMGGQLVTEPLALAGRRVLLNGRTVHDGVMQITFLGPDRQPLAGVAPLVFRGDRTDLPLCPPGMSAMPVTDSGLISLRIFLQNAGIHSLRAVPDAHA